MNRGHILQSSPVQQMMATGNPSCWWSLNNIRPAISQFEHHQQQQPQGTVPPSPFYPFSSAPPPPLPPAATNTTTTTTNNNNNNNNNMIFPHQLLMNMPTTISASSSLPFVPSSWGPSNQQEQLHPAESWSQLLMGAGMVMSGEEKAVMNHQFQTKKIENWEDHHEVMGIHHHHQQQHQASPPTSTINVDHVKQENSAVASSYVYGHDNCSTAIHEDYRSAALKPITTAAAAAAWSPHHQMMPVSSPQSCVTTFSNNNLLDFSSPISDARHPPRPPPPPPSSDRSSECNSTANTTSGGPTKKAKVQPSSTQSTIKVRKEKLGDRITALHQLVSPFGKTDTASVLLEALGYIRFLHNQIEALSLPYLTNTGSGNNKRQPQTTVQGERNSIFPEEPGQLLNNNKCLKRKGGPDLQDSSQEEEKDLRSRGLCLVPISCTLLVGSDNGADYWAPPALGGGFR